MVYLITSLDFAGYIAGSFRFYQVMYRGSSYPSVEKDSIILTTTTMKCSSPSDMAVYISEDTIYYSFDSLKAYYDGEFLTDAIKIRLNSVKYPIYLRLLRFPLIISYSWQVVDTCIQPANRIVPIRDLDGDGISDSLRVDSTHIRIIFVSTDSVKVETDTITVVFKLTMPMILYADSTDTIMYKNFKHTFKFVLRGKYLPYIGYEYLRADSTEYIYEYDYIRTYTSDSSHVSINMTMWPLFIRELVSTKIAENPIMETEDQVHELYDVNGRLLWKGKGNYKIQNLPRGVYFIKVGKRVKKVIKR